MAKIHGLVYILIGAFVSIMSWKLNQEKLLFFYYVGYFFIFVGVLKLIFNMIKSKAEKPKANVQAQPHKPPQLRQSVPKQPHHPASKHPQAFHQQIKYCHNCRTALRLHNKFCSNCGARV